MNYLAHPSLPTYISDNFIDSIEFTVLKTEMEKAIGNVKIWEWVLSSR